MSEPSLERLLEAEFADGAVVIGEVLIRQLGDGAFELTNRACMLHRLEVCAPDAAIEIAKFDDAKNYRPLKTAPNLRRDWKIIAPNLAAVIEAIDAIYPGRLAAWQTWKTDRLATTSLRSTLNRQSGMYRVAAKISDDQLDRLIGDFCRSDGKCLRTILWRRDEEGAPASRKLPPEKFDPAIDQTGRGERSIPLLCQEACNLLVAACRETARR